VSAERLICHYHLEKALSKTMRVYVCIYIIMQHPKLYKKTVGCWKYTFSITPLLCNIQYVCIFGNDVELNNTHRAHCCVAN